MVTAPVPFEHDPATAEGVGDKTLRSCLDVRPLDFEQAFGVIKVPRFTAPARLEPCELKLGSHRAVAEKYAFPDGFQKSLWHGWFLYIMWLLF